MHDTIKIVANYVAAVAEGIAVIIIMAGIVMSAVHYARKTFFIKPEEKVAVESRSRLGHALSLGLEFLIGADILRTAISPTWDDIGRLAAIVGIRTVLNFFLTRELRQHENAGGQQAHG